MTIPSPCVAGFATIRGKTNIGRDQTPPDSFWTAAAYLDCAAYSAFNDFQMGGGAFASFE